MSDARDVRARILEALSLAEHPLSGSELGRRLMLSRTAIWKHVRALRREGFGIEAVPGRGYRLSDDVLTEAAIRAHLGVPRRIGRSIRVLAETGSTNTDVLAAATAGEDEGLALFARRQTAGRGRLGRRWHTLPKALAFSVLLRPPMHPAEAPRLALLAAVAVHEALAAWAPGLGIKWPNDLLAGGRKLAGILTEMRAEPERVQAVAIGIGINLAPPPDGWPDDLRWPATDLETACGRPLPQAQVAARVLACLDRWYARLLREGFAPVRSAWLDAHVANGRTVRVWDGSGYIEGTAKGLDEDGALLLATGGRIRRIVAGECVPMEEG